METCPLPDYWIKELTDEGIIPTINDLYQNYNKDLGFVSEDELYVYLHYIVPKVMKKYNMYAAIEVAEEYRCFEDFDFRNSIQKIDFYRHQYIFIAIIIVGVLMFVILDGE